MPQSITGGRLAAIVVACALFSRHPLTAREIAATVPFRWSPGAVVVDVRVNGAGPFPFLLDTGSSHTSVSARLARTIAAPRVARTLLSTPAGDAWAAVVRVSRLALGPLAGVDLLATELPDDQLLPSVVGVIGRDLLGDRAFTLDYRNARLSWPDSVETDEAQTALLPLDTRGPVWLVGVSDAGRELALVPDSGAEQAVLFDRGQWKHLGELAGTNTIRSVTGERPASLGTLARLNMGGIQLVEHPVVVVEGAAVGLAHGDGLLPLHLFDRVAFRPREGLVQLSRRGSASAGNVGSN